MEDRCRHTDRTREWKTKRDTARRQDVLVEDRGTHAHTRRTREWKTERLAHRQDSKAEDRDTGTQTGHENGRHRDTGTQTGRETEWKTERH